MTVLEALNEINRAHNGWDLGCIGKAVAQVARENGVVIKRKNQKEGDKYVKVNFYPEDFSRQIFNEIDKYFLAKNATFDDKKVEVKPQNSHKKADIALPTSAKKKRKRVVKYTKVERKGGANE